MVKRIWYKLTNILAKMYANWRLASGLELLFPYSLMNTGYRWLFFWDVKVFFFFFDQYLPVFCANRISVSFRGIPSAHWTQVVGSVNQMSWSSGIKGQALDPSEVTQRLKTNGAESSLWWYQDRTRQGSTAESPGTVWGPALFKHGYHPSLQCTGVCAYFFP